MPTYTDYYYMIYIIITLSLSLCVCGKERYHHIWLPITPTYTILLTLTKEQRRSLYIEWVMKHKG